MLEHCFTPLLIHWWSTSRGPWRYKNHKLGIIYRIGDWGFLSQVKQSQKQKSPIPNWTKYPQFGILNSQLGIFSGSPLLLLVLWITAVMKLGRCIAYFPTKDLPTYHIHHTLGWWKPWLDLARLCLASLLKTSGLDKKCSRCQHIMCGRVSEVGQNMQNTSVRYARLGTVSAYRYMRGQPYSTYSTFGPLALLYGIDL